jgi:catechol 2,3-dioxygenase-like lactoylglutathione lyase family enzyme
MGAIMTQLRITAMDHIVLNVTDIERSLAFYINVIGLKGERVDQFRRGEVGFPSVRISESTLIDLMKVDAPPLTEGAPRNLNHYCMVAESLDLPALVEMLQRNDVPVLRGPVSRWGARGQAMSVYLLDPDGNEIEIRCY